MPLIGNCCFADQVFLREIGDIAEGVQSFTYWVEGRDSQVVKDFVAAYESAHGEIPSLYAAGSYMMAQVIAEALEATGGVVDGADFVTAARGLPSRTACTARSRSMTRTTRRPGLSRPVNAREDGTLWNVVDDTFPDVSQFWTYGKDAFLANPVFSRDFTGQ